MGIARRSLPLSWIQAQRKGGVEDLRRKIELLLGAEKTYQPAPAAFAAGPATRGLSDNYNHFALEAIMAGKAGRFPQA